MSVGTLQDLSLSKMLSFPFKVPPLLRLSASLLSKSKVKSESNIVLKCRTKENPNGHFSFYTSNFNIRSFNSSTCNPFEAHRLNRSLNPKPPFSSPPLPSPNPFSTSQIHYHKFLGPSSLTSSRFLTTKAAAILAEGGSKSGAVERTSVQAAMEGGEGEGLLAFHSDHAEVVLPEGHRFPMNKYLATRQLLEADSSLSDILTLLPSPLATYEELTRVHDQEYVRKVTTGELSPMEIRTTGFPWSPEMVRRSYASTGGTVAAMHAVMAGRRAVAGHLAGGTHHAFRDHGEGFCVFNDIAVAAAAALECYPDACHVAAPALVIDLDVHQGNGTAHIFDGDARVVSFSMHGANNYPWRSRTRSDYDIELRDATQDHEYLDLLGEWLPRLFDTHSPGLVFFQAGVDALKEDSFGRLSMTRSGLLRRNNMVYSACIERGVPLVITMGGGYSRPIEASILAHADVYRSAAYRYGTRPALERKSISSQKSD